ncbi:MAG: lysophospholipid acyltransferase family protein [Actinomycetota bacterium]|nr:lysophospholipid acyltransferase family protein [Actinomycetota bacterium]
MAYWVLKAVLTPVLLLLWRVRVEGREHVPRRGAAVLAANHQSFCDSFFIPLVIARRVTFVAKAEYFDSWRTAWFFRAAGQIPIRRDDGDASQRALDTATGVLARGKLLGIYPEGTRAPDGRLYRGRTGAARLAVATGAPVVPVALVGTRSIQPPGRRLMRPFHTVTVRFGPPLVAEPADGADPMALRAFTERLMAAIAELSGQERVDVYASEARGRLAAPAVAGTDVS